MVLYNIVGECIMETNKNQIISMSEANHNFSKVAKIADEYGRAVIFENEKPKYVIVNIEKSPIFELSDDEKIDVSAKRILIKYFDAFKELAK